MVCLGVVLFASILFGTLCASWSCMSISFTKLGMFSFIIFSNKFSISCCSSSPSGIPISWMLAHLEMSQSLLILTSFFFAFFFLHSVLVDCLFLPYVPNCWFEPWLHSLHCFLLIFTSLSVAFISSLMILPYSISSLSILITSVLNSASDRLAISVLLSSFSGVCSVLSFGPYFFVSSIWQPPHIYFCVLGRAILTPCLSTPVKFYGAEP